MTTSTPHRRQSSPGGRLLESHLRAIYAGISPHDQFVIDAEAGLIDLADYSAEHIARVFDAAN